MDIYIICPDLTGQIILKDTFITQSDPHINKKLQKIAFAAGSSSEALVKITSLVFHTRDCEKNKENKK